MSRGRAIRLIDGMTVIAVLGVVGILLVRGARVLASSTASSSPLMTQAVNDANAVPSIVFPSGKRLSRLSLHDLARTGLREGVITPAVQIIVYADYSCGWCAAHDSVLQAIMARYPEHVGVVYKAFVLGTAGPRLADVHAAAYCAAETGEFAAFHRAAYRQPDLAGGAEAWRAIARGIQYSDTLALERCVLGDRYRAHVKRDTEEGLGLGFRVTPSSIVGQHPVVGSRSFEALDSIIGLALAERR